VGVNRGNIAASYSTGEVNGDRYVAGLVGLNEYGNVTNSYSAGAVTGDRWIGGLVGGEADDPNIVLHSFWDLEITGQATSAGGTGKTTAEMQTAITYLDAGWDFVDETANGTEGIWWISDGRHYPRLWWEAGN
jgi:hypothetical protein